jgi:hypothetical protein
MAISWKFNISEIGNSGNYNISAVVTDDTKPVDYQKETVSVQGKYDTPERKAAVHATLKAEYLKKASATDAKVALELSAKTETEKL